MNNAFTIGIFLTGLLISATSPAEDDIAALAERGKTLFWEPASCWVCHGENAEGRIGPNLHFGPTPYDIAYQFQSNPQMGPLRELLKPVDDDFVALAVYLRELGGHDMDAIDVPTLRRSLASLDKPETDVDVVLTERDKLVEKIESWDSVLADWQRRAKTGNIKHDYKVRVAATYDAGEPKFTPQPGKTYFYENTGTNTNMFSSSKKAAPGFSTAELKKAESTTNKTNIMTAKSTQIVVGDAASKKVIAHYELPLALRGQVHTTVMSADAKYIYVIGAKAFGGPVDGPVLATPATLLKADALTLQPVKQLVVGGRVHHGQLFRDKYILLDTFARDADGLDIFLLDPNSDEIVGGVRDEELGGSTYTAFTDGKFIYALMEPLGYSYPSFTGYTAASKFHKGKLMAMRPFWVAKIDPDTWEVVKEYPYPGYRADWITFDAGSKHMYLPAGGSSNLSKINLGNL